MKIMSRSPFFATICSLCLAAALFAPAADAPPSPPGIRRPTIPGRAASAARAGGARPAAPSGKSGSAQQKAVTQPDGHGAMPLIPYDENPNALNFQDASADLVVTEYAMRTHRTVLKAPNVPQTTITLRTTPDVELSDEQYLRAIREALSLAGIVLKEEGDAFLRVLPQSEAGTHGLKPAYADEHGKYEDDPEDGRFVQKMVELKYIGIDEAQPVVNALMRPGAKVQTIERTNSILITDASENVNRIVEVLQYMDKPVIAREEFFTRHIKFAKAADVKARLDEIVTQAQNDEGGNTKKPTAAVESRQSGAPGMERRQLPPGVTFRNRRDRDEDSTPTTPDSVASLVAEAAKGVIRGKVAIIADERTNKLIVLTRPENMAFFDTIIPELDVETAPETLVDVYRLEHAVAEDVASLLNDLIGKSKPSDSDAKPGSGSRSKNGDRDSSSSSSSDRPQRAASAQASSSGDASRTRIGQLDADSISILSDERSNSLIVMAPAADMPSLLSIIQKLDIQLSQVVIETVILAITFKDSQETGMDWVQRAMLDGTGKDGPKLAFATSGGGGSGTPMATATLTTVDSVPKASGVNAYFTVFDWNTDIILRAVQNDSNAQIMSSPKITTMDNKEATFESTERIYWKGEETHYASSDYTSQSIKSEDIGIKLTVTPRINNKGYITLTIEQEIQSNDGYTELNGSQYPLLNTRKMGADLAVQSGETVVLGGLAQNSVSKSTTKVPILGSIPLLGWLFRHETDEQNRTDIVVFLTPRVLDTPAQMEDDARNTKASLETRGVWDPMWSSSRLADPISEEHARTVLSRASNTVTRARYPMTGYLTGLNRPDMLAEGEEANGPIQEAIDRAAEDGSVPYVHFSDVDAATRLKAANFNVTEERRSTAPEKTKANEPAKSADATEAENEAEDEAEESETTEAPAATEPPDAQGAALTAADEHAEGHLENKVNLSEPEI